MTIQRSPINMHRSDAPRQLTRVNKYRPTTSTNNPLILLTVERTRVGTASSRHPNASMFPVMIGRRGRRDGARVGYTVMYIESRSATAGDGN